MSNPEKQPRETEQYRGASMAVSETRSDGRIERQVATVLLASLAIGCFLVLRPFLSALLWAAILSFSTWPIYQRLEHLMGGRSALAASLMIVSAATLFALPIVALGSRLASEVPALAALVNRLVEEGPRPPPAWVKSLPVVGAHLETYWQSVAYDAAKLAADIKLYIGPVSEWLLGLGLSLGAAIGQVLLSLFVLFFFYRNGMAGSRVLRSALARVGGPIAEHLLSVAGATVRGVVYGIIGTNLVEALLAMLGLLIVGVPGAVLLGCAIFFLTLVPLAPALVFVPAILWLIAQHATLSAIFLAAWYVLVFVILEGGLRAYFISRGGDLPLVLVFLGMVGGVVAVGFLGIFLGPTLLAIGYTVLQEWTNAASLQGDRSQTLRRLPEG
jgi:predicted PurR-regulated permease PerM